MRGAERSAGCWSRAGRVCDLCVKPPRARGASPIPMPLPSEMPKRPPPKLKRKCCRKYRKKGKYCKKCPLYWEAVAKGKALPGRR